MIHNISMLAHVQGTEDIVSKINLIKLICSFICSFVKHFELPMCMNAEMDEQQRNLYTCALTS